MRLWSIHPKYLDSKGLIALWREALLAQAVLNGKTKGYTRHPQLERFLESENSLKAIGTYLHFILIEALERGYEFQRDKIISEDSVFNSQIGVSNKQIEYEFEHLQNKLKKRDEKKYHENLGVRLIEPHPIFSVYEGAIEAWEKVKF